MNKKVELYPDQIFGDLKIIEFAYSSGDRYWKYQCSCGKINKTTASKLISGKCVRCPECSKKFSANKRTYTLNDIIQCANKLQENRYDYSDAKYTGIHDYIFNIKCSKHNIIFNQIAHDHLRKKHTGCRECSAESRNKTTKNNREKSLKKFINKAKEIYGERYNYDKFEYSSYNKGIIICFIHGEFEVTPYNHLNGNGCPKCPKPTSISEAMTRLILENHYNVKLPAIRPEFLKNPKTGKNLQLDMYNAKDKLAFEYGSYYHGKNHTGMNEDGIERDRIKRILCEQNQIKLINIPEPSGNIIGNIEKFYYYIKNFLEKYNIFVKLDITKIDWSVIGNYFRDEQMNKLYQKLKYNNYELVSGVYLGTNSEFILKCNKDEHGLFARTYNSIVIAETRCPKCVADEKKNSWKEKYMTPAKKQEAERQKLMYNGCMDKLLWRIN